MNPQLFALLARGGWPEARLDGLTVRPDGALELARTTTGRVPAGTLEAGPLDAGEDGQWTSVAVDAELPPDTKVGLETSTADDPSAPPTWRPVPTLDALVGRGRHLWVRLTLEARAPAVSPMIREVRAEADPDTYLDHLPRMYARQDVSGDLGRLLALARSVVGDLQASIDLLGRRFNAATAPAETLAWLAGWQAFDTPPELLRGEDPTRLRALLAELPELYAQRGTPRGIVRMVEVQTGIRPLLLEHFRHRASWALGRTGALGIDTALAGSSADGMTLDSGVVGPGTLEDPQIYGRGVFGDTAHRFTAVFPAGRLSRSQRQRVADVIEAEKPAHTRHHLCLVGPTFRVGVQATLGIDTIVGRDDARIELT